MQRPGGCCSDQVLQSCCILPCGLFHNVVRPVDASGTGVLLSCCIQRFAIGCRTRNLISLFMSTTIFVSDLRRSPGPLMREEGDFIDQLAHLSFYDEKNPVREWMEYGRSNRAPVLDEDDDDGDIPLPSHIVRDQINVSDLREATGNDSISDWARQNIGDTHLGKRKLQKGPKKGDSKRRKGKGTAKPVSSDTETDDGEGERSPLYQESKDSTSPDDSDDSDGADADAGGGASASGGGAAGAAGGSGGARGVRFTGIYCTYKYTHISDYEY